MQIHSQAHKRSATCVVVQIIMFGTASFGMLPDSLLKDYVLTKKRVKRNKSLSSSSSLNEDLKWRRSLLQTNRKSFGPKTMKRAGLIKINQKFHQKMTKFRLLLLIRYERTSSALIHLFLTRAVQMTWLINHTFLPVNSHKFPDAGLRLAEEDSSQITKGMCCSNVLTVAVESYVISCWSRFSV